MGHVDPSLLPKNGQFTGTLTDGSRPGPRVPDGTDTTDTPCISDVCVVCDRVMMHGR